MKFKTGILVSFLFIGLLTAPNCIFAQQYQDSAPNTVIKSDLQSTTLLNSLIPLVKGGGGGSKGGSSSSSSKIHTDDADNSGDNSTGDDSGWNWMTIIIILVLILGIIGVLVWYFFLRK